MSAWVTADTSVNLKRGTMTTSVYHFINDRQWQLLYEENTVCLMIKQATLHMRTNNRLPGHQT